MKMSIVLTIFPDMFTISSKYIDKLEKACYYFVKRIYFIHAPNKKAKPNFKRRKTP